MLWQLDFWNLSHVVATKTWSELVSKSRSCLNLSPHRFLVAESMSQVWEVCDGGKCMFEVSQHPWGLYKHIIYCNYWKINHVCFIVFRYNGYNHL